MLQQDVQMINEEKSLESGEIKGCKVKNLELMQDFSMINNIFCDKTGTLTKNILIFNCLVVDGSSFSIKDGKDKYAESIKNHSKIDDKFLDFWRCLCVCHDVMQVMLPA